MKDFSTTELHLIAAARAFVVGDVVPKVSAWERGESESRDALPKAATRGLLGMEVPVEFGGSDVSFACKAWISELLAAADFGLAMSLINSHNVAAALAREASGDLARRYIPDLLSGHRVGCTALTESGAGSDFAAISTQARQVADGWRLDGRKAWITNATHADVMIVYAQTHPGSGAKGIAAFVVDAARPGFRREPMADFSAGRSIGVGGFSLEAYFCRHDEMLYRPGQAFKSALRSINGARVYVAAMCCGMVSESLRVACAFGVQRQTFGKTLSQHQGWRWGLADTAIDLDAARLLVDAAAALIDSGADAQGAAARAKVFATRVAQEHISSLLHAMGAEGLRDSYPFMRHLAATQMATLVDGSTEMLLERVAKDISPA